ncbi:MAG: OmpA family protein [Bacteroidota bacterium]
MKKFFSLLLFATAIMAFTNANAQETKFKGDFKNRYVQADNYMNVGNYEESLRIFLSLDSIVPNNANLLFNIGLCYLNIPYNKSKSIPYFIRASKNISLAYTGEYNETSAPVFVYYYLGKSYHINYQIDKAVEYFQKFRGYLTETETDLLKDVDRQIEMCYNAKKMFENPLDIKIDNLGPSINTKQAEYSPVISKDEKTIIFTSRRDGSTGGNKDDKGKFYEDIYIATKDGSGVWEAAKPIGNNINTNRHEASISLSADGKQLFIYKDDGGDGNIYTSFNKDGNWSVPTKLNTPVNSKAWETHACLSPDGATLYFVSDREGGYGGRDIYKSEKKGSGEWGPVINLGPAINTAYDEDSPFILPDGVSLYFSSQGHESMGGFDIYSATLSDDGFWGRPENLGYPINTTEDDVFYVPTEDEKHAYYSTVKKDGFGDLDLYLITIVRGKSRVVTLAGSITDGMTYKPLVAKIEVIDNVKKQVVANLNSNKLGDFFCTLPPSNYTINVTSPKHKDYSETFDIRADEKLSEIQKDIILDRLEEVVLNKNDYEVGEKIILKKIFYDFNKSELRPESIVELARLTKLMKDIPTLKIEISGHTDNVGTAEYNVKLSERRAKSVVDYLVEKGIDAKRLTFKGYGFDQPIATNTTEEGRQLNRRTEFKILYK